MHHKSIESQLVYTKPSPEKIRNALNTAAAAPPDLASIDYESELLSYNWRSDPLKIFAPWKLGLESSFN